MWLDTYIYHIVIKIVPYSWRYNKMREQICIYGKNIIYVFKDIRGVLERKKETTEEENQHPQEGGISK